jgi:uncharacterized membrane protein YdbT with pleckstrin-like domain
MDWPQKILHPQEEIVFRSKAPETVFLAPFILMLILFFAGHHGIFFWLAVFFSLAGVFKYFYYEHIVTNKRIITKYGFFYLRYRELPIEKVDNVTCWQSFADRLLGTGVVTLFGTGIITRKIKRIAKAADFRNAIHSQLSTEPEHYFDG